MTVRVRKDSLFQYALPYFDEYQSEYVWGIADPPDPIKREDDQFVVLRENDRLDLLAYRYLGDVRFYWIVMHYNGIKDALDLANHIGKQLRLPSKTTVEKVFVDAST